MRNALTALVLVAGCFASLLAATAAPQETTTSETAVVNQRSGGPSDGDLAPQAQNPLLPSWNMIAPVRFPLMDQPKASATPGASSDLGQLKPSLSINYNLTSGWYLTNTPFIAPSGDASAAGSDVAKPIQTPDWQLRGQIAFLFRD